MTNENETANVKQFNVLDDKRLTSSVSRLQSRTNHVKKVLDEFFGDDLYKKASTADRVKYDLFLAYATTSLFWAYLRSTGVDPRQHALKQEVDRIKTYMAKAKSVHDRHLRPKVDQAASKRFVRSALWVPGNDKAQNDSRKRKLNMDDE